MYELHSWFKLGAGPYVEEDDLEGRVTALRDRTDRLIWSEEGIRLIRIQESAFLTAHTHGNHARGYVDEVVALIAHVTETFPETEGVAYELEEQVSLQTGTGLYRVAIVQGGRVCQSLDPFLSPVDRTSRVGRGADSVPPVALPALPEASGHDVREADHERTTIESHGWVILDDEDDEKDLRNPEFDVHVEAFEEYTSQLRWPNGRAEIRRMNGSIVLTLDGFTESESDEERALSDLLCHAVKVFPSSDGIVHRRNALDPYCGDGARSVVVVRDGSLRVRPDPFLSVSHFGDEL